MEEPKQLTSNALKEKSISLDLGSWVECIDSSLKRRIKIGMNFVVSVEDFLVENGEVKGG